MYSRGSVLPLFVKQIRAGRPLTVTEPEMTRFLMPLRDSVDLVSFAFTQARPGDLFVRKAPSASMAQLVRAVPSVFGLTDYPTEVIGWRHGEKLYETLASAQELSTAEDLGDYYRICMDQRDLHYKAYFTEGLTKAQLFDYLEELEERTRGKANRELPHQPPGSPVWRLAPKEQAFQGRSPRALALQLKDSKQSHMTPEELHTHVKDDALVGWGWNPGPGRKAIPVSREKFVAAVPAQHHFDMSSSQTGIAPSSRAPAWWRKPGTLGATPTPRATRAAGLKPER